MIVRELPHGRSVPFEVVAAQLCSIVRRPIRPVGSAIDPGREVNVHAHGSFLGCRRLVTGCSEGFPCYLAGTSKNVRPPEVNECDSEHTVSVIVSASTLRQPGRLQSPQVATPKVVADTFVDFQGSCSLQLGRPHKG